MVFLEIDLYALAVELGGKALKTRAAKTRIIVGGLVKCIEVRPQQVSPTDGRARSARPFMGITPQREERPNVLPDEN